MFKMLIFWHSKCTRTGEARPRLAKYGKRFMVSNALFLILPVTPRHEGSFSHWTDPRTRPGRAALHTYG